MSPSPSPSPSSSYDHLPTPPLLILRPPPHPPSYDHLPTPSSSYDHLPTPTSSYDHLPTSTPPTPRPRHLIQHPLAPRPPSPTAGSLQSSDSTSDLDSESTSSQGGSTDAEREWQESLQQLELLLTMVVVPFAGKYLGRRCAYWGWTRFMEWKYPVEVVVTSKPRFRAAGIVEAASPL
ncbi:MAG: hypothetical protein FRX48_01774 [Lasallia pustulata]|uniref:Uncharacterized protein n=1 Tax=Lasallia pustulata TaxID=136370 RepID=A0A5M8PZ49_9LECA|nr:MAG: hypothetical protein FRX48_01774 [Lasallia pustulata]